MRPREVHGGRVEIECGVCENWMYGGDGVDGSCLEGTNIRRTDVC